MLTAKGQNQAQLLKLYARYLARTNPALGHVLEAAITVMERNVAAFAAADGPSIEAVRGRFLAIEGRKRRSSLPVRRQLEIHAREIKLSRNTLPDDRDAQLPLRAPLHDLPPLPRSGRPRSASRVRPYGRPGGKALPPLRLRRGVPGTRGRPASPRAPHARVEDHEDPRRPSLDPDAAPAAPGLRPKPPGALAVPGRAPFPRRDHRGAGAAPRGDPREDGPSPLSRIPLQPLTPVSVILFCATPVASARLRVATIARDAGLRGILPSVFEGELTPYRRGRLLEAVRSAVRRIRPVHLEVLSLPAGHFLKRLVRVRG